MFPATGSLVGDYGIEFSVAERGLVDAQVRPDVLGEIHAIARREDLPLYLSIASNRSDAACTDAQTNRRLYRRTTQESGP